MAHKLNEWIAQTVKVKENIELKWNPHCKCFFLQRFIGMTQLNVGTIHSTAPATFVSMRLSSRRQAVNWWYLPSISHSRTVTALVPWPPRPKVAKQENGRLHAQKNWLLARVTDRWHDEAKGQGDKVTKAVIMQEWEKGEDITSSIFDSFTTQ